MTAVWHRFSLSLAQGKAAMVAHGPRWRRRIAGGALALLGLGAAQTAVAGEVWRVPTREGVHTTVWWEAAPVGEGASNARATVLLFPGGVGGFGRVAQGRPSSDNFLVRSAQAFTDQGLNVAIFGRANGQELQPADRMGSDHLQDIRQVVQAVRTHSNAPLWLVGTSRGTTSVASAAIALQDAGLAGVVMTSSIVAADEPGALPSLDLAAIRVPVLLVQHAKDACKLCTPSAMPAVLQRLVQAPVKQLRLVDGGRNPSGGVCHAMHWHGFIGMEDDAVQLIAQWIRQPQP